MNRAVRSALRPTAMRVVVSAALLISGAATVGWPAAAAADATDAGAFTAVPAARVLDTARGVGAPARPVAPKGTVLLTVGGVPDTGVSAVLLNVTASGATSAGGVRVYPGGAARPAAPVLSFAARQVATNFVVAAVGTGGRIALYNGSASSTVQLAADVYGYYRAGTPTAAGTFAAVPQTTVLDTSTGSGPVRAKKAAVVQMTGRAGVPADGVSGVVLNVTAFGSSASSGVRVYATGGARPTRPSLVYTAGQASNNLVVAPVGAGGQVSLYNAAASGAVQLRVDVVGYLVAGSAVVDGAIRSLPQASVFTYTLAPKTSTVLDMTGRSGVPQVGVSGVLLDVLATKGTAAGSVQVFPTGSSGAPVPSLAFAPNRAVEHFVSVPLGTNDEVTFANTSATASVTLSADVVGYVVRATPTPAVTNLTAHPTTSSVDLAWTKPPGVADVEIRRATGPTPPANPTDGIPIAITTANNYADTDVASSTQYSYSVFSRSDSGTYGPGATATATTADAAPCTIHFTGGHSSSWDDPVNWDSGAVPTPQDWVCVADGRGVDLVTDRSVRGVTIDGFLEVEGSLTVTDLVRSSASYGLLYLFGRMSSMGRFDMKGDVNANGSPVTLDGYFNNEGSFHLGRGGTVLLTAGSKFVNQGDMSMAYSSTVRGECPAGGEGALAAFDNSGSWTASGATDSPVAIGEGGCLLTSITGSLYLDYLDIKFGGSIAIADTASIDGASTSGVVVDGALISDVASFGSVATVTVNGSVRVNHDLSLNDLEVDGGTVDIAPGTTLTTATSGFTDATLKLAGSSSDAIGRLVSTATPRSFGLSLDLETGDWNPACGTHVVAVSTVDASSDFAVVYSTPALPAGASWVGEHTGTTVGATVRCDPSPQGRFSFTFDSPANPWSSADLATLQSWTRDGSPEMNAVYQIAGHPVSDVTINIVQGSGGFAGDYSPHTMGLGRVALDVFLHELNHAVHDRWILNNSVWEEGLARAGEDEELRILAEQGITSPSGDPRHDYTYDRYYDAMNVADAGVQNGGIYGYGDSSLGLLRYELAGYAFGKILIEQPSFLARFNERLFRQFPDGNVPVAQLETVAASVAGTVEGQPLLSWYPAQGVFNADPPRGRRLFQRVNQFTGDFFFRSADGTEAPQSEGSITMAIYDVQDDLLWQGTDRVTPGYGWASFSPVLGSYDGRIKVVATATSSIGTVSSTYYRQSGNEQGVFGVVTNESSGTVTFTSPTAAFAPETVHVVNGAFVAPDLGSVRGVIVARYTDSSGVATTKTFTKAESPYSLVITAG